MNVDEIQQKVQSMKRMVNEKLLKTSKIVLRFSIITPASSYSFLHVISIISYVFADTVIPLVSAACSTVSTDFKYFWFTKSHRKLSGNSQKHGNVAKPKTASILNSHFNINIWRKLKWFKVFKKILN